MYCAATINLLKSTSLELYEIGEGRTILTTLFVEPITGKKQVQIIRYFTKSEYENKKKALHEDMDKRSYGGYRLKQGVVSPYANAILNKEALGQLVEKKDELQYASWQLEMQQASGLSNVMLPLYRGWYLNVDYEINVIHIRQYWRSREDQELKPKRNGVCLSPAEFKCFLALVEHLHEQL